MTNRVKAIKELEKDPTIVFVSGSRYEELQKKLGLNAMYNRIYHNSYPKTYFTGIQYRRKLYLMKV